MSVDVLLRSRPPTPFRCRAKRGTSTVLLLDRHLGPGRMTTHLSVSTKSRQVHFSASAARSLVETTFVGPDRPTGIYAFNDEYAILLLGALTRLGIEVSQEVALVGTDDLTVGELVWPSLTTIRFDALTIGKRAVEMLHTLHQGLPLPEELTRPLMPQLIQREST